MLNFRDQSYQSREPNEIFDKLGELSVQFIDIENGKVFIYCEDKDERMIIINDLSEFPEIYGLYNPVAEVTRDYIGNEYFIHRIDLAQLGLIKGKEAKFLAVKLQEIMTEYSINNRFKLLEKAKELGLVDLQLEP